MNFILSKKAQKNLNKLDKQTQVRIIKTIRRFNLTPGAVDLKKIKGHNSKWRIRVGAYRIIININWTAERAEIEGISDRKDAYKGL